jgi:Uma2 family endonuclease
MNIIRRPDVQTVPKDIPIIAIDMPVMYEDEGQEEMGESEVHVITIEILRNGLRDHFAPWPNSHVFSDINLYYHPLKRKSYISPDVMVVALPKPLQRRLVSYRIGKNRPAPTVAIEVLSRRSAQQQDVSNKPELYAELGVAEYILVDATGEFLPQRLLLKRLRKSGAWDDEQDPDGGVTSRHGFRVVIEKDGDVRVIDGPTGKRYLRPEEASAAEEARWQAEQERRKAEARAQELEHKLREAEAKLARLQKKSKK